MHHCRARVPLFADLNKHSTIKIVLFIELYSLFYLKLKIKFCWFIFEEYLCTKIVKRLLFVIKPPFMNKSSQYTFTILVPVYNEEENIAHLEERLCDFLPHSLYSTCVLFVNDGSSDRSAQLIQEACTRHQGFFYISLQHRCGLSGALKAGIDETESTYMGYMDADLQTTPEDFNLLLAHIKEYEMVTGIRVNRKDSLFKRLQSKIANAFRRSMTHDGMQDTGCPLKVLHTDYARKIPFFTGMHRFLPALVQMMGGKVLQIPVHHYPRSAGKSKYHLWNRLTGPFIDCFAYRWMRKRYINYQIEANNLQDDL